MARTGRDHPYRPEGSFGMKVRTISSRPGIATRTTSPHANRIQTSMSTRKSSSTNCFLADTYARAARRGIHIQIPRFGGRTIDFDPEKSSQSRRDIASPSVPTGSIRTPRSRTTSSWDRGTTAVVAPRRASSRTRCSRCRTLRTSPVRPTSPMTTVPAETERPWCAPAMARAMARSAAGSTTRAPPATAAKTS